jgi:dTDP-4-amino-4,6-dideoxygalactose transaminase
MIYSLAASSWDDCEYSALERVIKAGDFTMGREVFDFEQRFADWIGCKFAVMVNSGSSANLLMVAALMYRRDGFLKPGDEVIVPAVSWSTTYHPLQQYGLKVKFVDIDAKTLNLDLLQLEQAITPGTRAILSVNLLGNPNNFRKLNSIIQGRDIILLEDNCEALGASFGGKFTGTFGLMGTFSFFFSHHISTMEGGIIVTDDEELHHILLCIRSHGWTRNLPKINRVCGEKDDDDFNEAYRFVLPGYNLRPLEFSGAVGKEQLKKLTKILEVRRRNALYCQSVFDSIPWFQMQKEVGESSWFGFSLVLGEDAPYDRNSIVRKLRNVGVEVRPIVAGNFVKNQTLKWYNYVIHGQLNNSEYIDKHGFYVGNHHYSLEKQIDLLSSALCTGY